MVMVDQWGITHGKKEGEGGSGERTPFVFDSWTTVRGTPTESGTPASGAIALMMGAGPPFGEWKTSSRCASLTRDVDDGTWRSELSHAPPSQKNPPTTHSVKCHVESHKRTSEGNNCRVVQRE